jgi:site-specific DNA-methyltransferase (adenine-specific)
MGKTWDGGDIAFNPEMWKECLRVLKPGGHLLSFSGTRTYHRMVVAIEDAGFEIRDMIEWVYGSGFPKSHNIGKAVDKIQGNEREVVGSDRSGSSSRAYQSEEQTTAGEYNIDKGTSEWEGWGTALKPSHEPICLARKPLTEKTVAENVLKYGTGGINIDESRVGNEGGTAKGTFPNEDSNGIYGNGLNGACEIKDIGMGRFPANLIHDNSEEVRECFPETKSSSKAMRGARPKSPAMVGDRNYVEMSDEPRGIDDNGGSASRFFKSIIYQAKASKSERNKGCEGLEKEVKGMNFGGELAGSGKPINIGANKNFHPTVKPIALMEYLIKMITPKGGIVLEPFAGSGSTLVAAKDNDFQYIGIELTEEYLPIIEARTGCEIIKEKQKITPEIKEEKSLCKEEYKDTCECGGKIKKTASGRVCEDCLKEY